jgi:hypothetical protein
VSIDWLPAPPAHFMVLPICDSLTGGKGCKTHSQMDANCLENDFNAWRATYMLLNANSSFVGF